MAEETATLYERVGGDEWFTALVDRFYEGVVGDPRLAPLYPEDLTAPKAHLAAFLVQYWGGPTTYSDERGHPRLRMRHMPFAIGSAEANAWFTHMRDAVDAAEGLDPADRQALLDYFAMAARHLINQEA